MSDSVANLAVDENDLLSAFTHNSAEDNVAVMADDVPNESGSGIDYKLSYFEPQFGKTYKIKFITNPRGAVITHRNIYKKLPDPTRPGKTFQYVSSNSAKTCQVLELFFELNKLKKEGNPLAIQKLKNFLPLTQQAVALVQILASDDASEIGLFRMMTFSTGEKNSPIAELINEKMNPSEALIKEGFVKEDIFNIFDSSVMLVTCTEEEYEGGVKGRGFTKSKWSPNRDSASVKYVKIGEDGVTENEITHKFSKADLSEDGKSFTSPQAKEAFMELIKQLNVDALDIHNMFAYKRLDDPKNSESTNKYLVDVQAKVDTIVPIIRNAQTMSAIKSANVAEGGEAKQNTFAQNAPTELANSVMNQAVETTTTEAPAQTAQVSDEVNDILNS